MRIRLAILVLAGAALFWASLASAHPFHTTTLEAEYLPEAKRLEASLRVDPEALRLTLTEATGSPLKLEAIGREHPQLGAWVASVVHVRGRDGQALPVKFRGYKWEKDGLWLFFTVELPQGLRGATVLSSAFLDREAKQMNAVLIRQGEELVFSRIFTGRTVKAAPIP